MFRVGLHHRPWSWTMRGGLFPWSYLMVQLPWYDFLKNWYTNPWGPSLGVNGMCLKKNGHAPKNECADFFNICPKRTVWKKNKKTKKTSLTILLYSLGLPLSSLLVRCVQDVACKSSHNNVYKKMSDWTWPTWSTFPTSAAVLLGIFLY